MNYIAIAFRFLYIFLFINNIAFCQFPLTAFERNPQSSTTYQECIQFYKELAKKNKYVSIVEAGMSDVEAAIHTIIISNQKEKNYIDCKKNNKIVFPLLIVLVVPLVLLMSYYSTSVLGTLFHKTEELQKPVSISEIERPNYTLNAIIIDTDLPKFPIDYDSLVKTLNLSLTQHQKTTLLLYGESISKSNHTNITDAYKELIEKDIPILIPQKYINEYLNNRFDEYKLQLESVPKEIEKSIKIISRNNS